MTQGVDYFPMDVDFFEDDKIALIEAEFGLKGAIVALRLLCKIYKNGYYYQWGGDECLLFARKMGAEFVPNAVAEVVAGLVRRSFFDKRVFDTFGVLTSVGIQQRYFDIVKRRQRVEVNPDYLLIDVAKFSNVYILNKNVDIAGKNVNISPQSKGKESKVNSLKKEKERKSAVSVDYREKSLQDCYTILSGDVEWIETVTMNTRTSGRSTFTVETFHGYLERFFAKLQNEGETKKSVRDAKAHFSRWLAIELQKKDGNTKQSAATSKSAANDYAMQRYLEERRRVEAGMASEVPKPF